MPDFIRQAFAPENWPTFAFVTTRVAGLMLAAPLWSMTAIPPAARAAIVVLLAVALLPGSPPAALSGGVLDLPLSLALELVLGIAIGLTAAVIVQGATLAGEVVSQQMGLHIAPALSPMPDVDVSGVGQLKGFLAVLIFVAVGGHLALLAGLADSLRAVPPGVPFGFETGVASGAMLMRSLYGCALLAAAPVMVTLLLTHVAVAILGRAVPQLNVLMVSFPLMIGVGLIMVGASLPITATVVGGWMQDLPETLAGVVESFQRSP